MTNRPLPMPDPPGPLWVKVPHLPGPINCIDWILVPAWLHERFHAEGYEHTHRGVNE